ncbi:MAG: FHA domain-containing protein [Planctomycetota bacterium]
MAELMFEKGFLKGRAIRIPEGRFLVVGRAKEAGLPLPDPQLSRRHCKLTHALEGVTLEDLGSRNGTYVNNQAITKVKLKHGDQIHFGDQAAQYIDPQRVTDSSGELEMEAEATREIPELEPGQAMLLNPPKIVRGPEGAPAPQAPTQVGTPAGFALGAANAPVAPQGFLPPPGQGFLPPSPGPALIADEDGDAELPQIDDPMPLPPALEEAIEADLSAPLPQLPQLPANPISMEETLVRPHGKSTSNIETGKAPAPKSKIKKLMESYKAEVMASTIDDVKPVPKIRPATTLRGPGSRDATPDLGSPIQADLTPASGTVGAGDTADARSRGGTGRANPVVGATPSSSSAAPASGATAGGSGSPATPAAVEATWENEDRIENFIEAADEQLRPGQKSPAAADAPPRSPKTIPLRQSPGTPAADAAPAGLLDDAQLEQELAEEPEVIDVAPDGPFEAPEDPLPTAPGALRPDETGTIDVDEVLGAKGDIVIDSSRIDRHREIADEIFRAAQVEGDPAAPVETEDPDEVIEEVGEDFDLDSLEQVAAPTLDLGQLDRTEGTAESATGIEVLEDGPPVAAAPAPAVRPARSERKITPPPSLPPILVDEHLEGIGANELYSQCEELYHAPAARPAPDANLLASALAEPEEFTDLQP